MAYDTTMVIRVREALGSRGTVDERNMFGSLGFMVNGKLAICVQANAVMYKLSSADAAKFIEQGVASRAVMGKRTMKNWVVVPNDALAKEVLFEAILNQTLHNDDSELQ